MYNWKLSGGDNLGKSWLTMCSIHELSGSKVIFACLFIPQAHCHLYIVDTFVKSVDTVQTTEPVRLVLRQLCTLYALYGISKNAGDFLEVGSWHLKVHLVVD